MDALQTNAALAVSALAGAALLLVAAHHRRSSKHQQLPYPPGPPAHFLLGNLFDLPTGPEEWKKFADMGKKYGPVVHLGVLVRDVIVLNSFKAAKDLLDKRSAIYSDRARFPMVGELMGFEWTVAMQRYGDYWRMHRRAIHQQFNEAATRELWPEITRLNTVFLNSLLHSPDRFWEHTRWLAGANIMSITYGMDSQIKDDPYIQLGEESLQIASRAGAQGAYLVDVLPFLKYLPEWLPGMGFKRQARIWKATQLRARDEPVDFVKEQLASGNARRSMTSHLLSSDLDGQPIPEDVIRNSTGMVYFAGADTSVGTMQAFFLAMVLNPGAQRAAQAELDAFLATQADGGRMPQMGDRAALPYVSALFREVVRKYPPLPLGVPHRLMQDDAYEGMRIPRDALVLPNAWAMFNDEEHYPHPEKFEPARFLGPNGQLDARVLDPADISFGFGRRVCPGRYFADAEVWLMIATVLYCFDIAPARDERGVEIVPSEVMSSGIVSALTKFPCVISPRSPAKEALVLASA
ncbi:cytochrome P450 [Auricularia subglabra TFB-10046 SS5]|nr:cytochrome P450 [Auricularia subglabra TFB-10046 SS5]